jgi:methylaspartate ammonia-lyase
MTNETLITQKLYKALCAKYEAEMLDAESSLLIYFTSPVGIGEHPQHIEEMDKLVEKITNAKDKLETIVEFYKYN